MKKPLLFVLSVMLLLSGCTNTSNTISDSSSLPNNSNPPITSNSDDPPNPSIVPLTSVEPWLSSLRATSVDYLKVTSQCGCIAPGSFIEHKYIEDATYIRDLLAHLKTLIVHAYPHSATFPFVAPGEATTTVEFYFDGIHRTLTSLIGYGRNANGFYKYQDHLLLPLPQDYEKTFTILAITDEYEIFDDDDNELTGTNLEIASFEFVQLTEAYGLDVLEHEFKVVLFNNIELYVWDEENFGVQNGTTFERYKLISAANFTPLFAGYRTIRSFEEYKDLPEVATNIVYYTNMNTYESEMHLSIRGGERFILKEDELPTIMAAVHALQYSILPLDASYMVGPIFHVLYIYEGANMWSIDLELLVHNSRLYFPVGGVSLAQNAYSARVNLPGKFSTLMAAHTANILTNDDLALIGAFHNSSGSELYPEAIPEVILDVISAIILYDLHAVGKFNARVEDVELLAYYGDYNSAYAFMYITSFSVYTEAEWQETIGETTFYYNNGNQIFVYGPHE